MNILKQKCDTLLNELYSFSAEIVYFGNPILDDRLGIFEDEIGFELPQDYKYILKLHNGISLLETTLLGLDEMYKEASLDAVYKFEHLNMASALPKEFLPFSADGRGNHYCLDLAKINNNICPVVFWQWDFDYESIENVEVTNESLMSWIKEVMIDWKLENYNYDGSEKRVE